MVNKSMASQFSYRINEELKTFTNSSANLSFKNRRNCLIFGYFGELISRCVAEYTAGAA